MGKRQLSYIVIACIIALMVIPILCIRKPEKPGHSHERLRAAICLDGHRSRSIHFSTGFNYELLRGFAATEQLDADIFLAQLDSCLIDSLQLDSIDIIVVPVSADSLLEDMAVSVMQEDSTVWVASGKHKKFIHRINSYLSGVRASEDYPEFVDRFAHSYEPFSRDRRGKTYRNASPYDDILKRHAASIGWDWRMLCALVWQESKFHIEARSRKGAEGLMQMIPSTAKSFGHDDMLDPERNVETGVRYLARLQRMFAQDVSEDDLMKVTLAAYNAGEGRIKDCISYAKGHGLPHSTWEEIEAVIPHLRESGNIDSTVSLGVFKGYETIRYIRITDSLYRAFCTIIPGAKPTAPARSSQDQPSPQKDTVSAAGPSRQETTEGQPQE